MANLIRAIVALFWLIASGFIGFLAYIVVQTEGDPRALWGWMVMCGFTFLSVTFLAYTVIFGSSQHDEKQHPGNA
jgi:CHASE1-domain containing sensor protein